MEALKLEGRRFGKWSIISRSDCKKGVYWDCVCDCGTESLIISSSLVSGNSTSCGCDRKRVLKHQMSKSPEYGVWSGIKQRCTNTTHKSWSIYGGRGIGVSEEWLDFDCFIKDMGLRPSDSHSIERMDNDKGYSKENCKWCLREEQANNTRTNHFLTAFGDRMTVTQWTRADVCTVTSQTICKRLTRGWSEAAAISAPSRSTKEAAELHGKALASFTEVK